MPARIDDSHHPFKRKGKLGPGPRKRLPIAQQKDWECSNKPPTSKHYVTICRWVGDGDRKPRKILRNKKSKKRYNKLYRKWVKRADGWRTKPARRGYSCRRTRSTSCK